MNREKTLDSIPIDVFLDIFSRLPAKSVGRSCCVSNRWASILGSQDFKELFLTMSSTRPRLLFALKPYNGDECLFYSSPHPHNHYEKSTVVVTADFHTKFPKSQSDCIYASGLSWRNIQCPLTHYPQGKGICINGVLYYLASHDEKPYMIVSFDVRYEKFRFINKKCHSYELINYKGNPIWPCLYIIGSFSHFA
ncbi:Contains similarity to gi/3249080 T13D8.24 MYB transcription factor homolog from A. thaliana BAC gb/AC004473 [Arabidopsis thaliana]|uniref:Putative F-box protein At1g31072 n=1 Tax=Arabidopsis thaliana TaxID=3702 RepID=FB25_ARATH|nr:RecName: Full=Putative F-box protein At1g31072 [Arabidopsis thaliana]AAD21701.1 Contains similarity to gi/3249080 T13D8.24 MYB transcription factor homolog from A. thaliana BAC gb/AC004473 [Arabidopsis thaliana]